MIESMMTNAEQFLYLLSLVYYALDQVLKNQAFE